MKSWNSNRQKFLQSDSLDSTRFSNSCFPKDTALSFFSKSQSLVFYFCCINTVKNVTSHPFSRNLSDQNWQKVLLVLRSLENQSHISSALSPSSSLQRINRKLFKWSRRLIPKNHENRLLHRIWSPHWPNVAKVIIVLNYLDIPNPTSRKQRYWIRLSRSEMTVTSFWTFLPYDKFWLRLLDWNFDKLNMQKGSINVVCRLSNWLISKAISLNSFDKLTIEMFLVKFGWCSKRICCLFDRIYIRLISLKISHAIEPLVFIPFHEIEHDALTSLQKC